MLSGEKPVTVKAAARIATLAAALDFDDDADTQPCACDGEAGVSF